MLIYVDIQHSFIREPIKLAIANAMGTMITFVNSEEKAQLVIGTSDKKYSIHSIILSDDQNTLIENDLAIFINPTPTNSDEMRSLVFKIQTCIGMLECQS